MERLEQLTISELAEKTGVTPRTIRYYSEEGLIPHPIGTGQRRFYGYEHYIRLRLIKMLQEEDIPLKKIKARLENLSLSEMQELVDLGHKINSPEQQKARAHPMQLLAAVLTSSKPQINADSPEFNEQLMLRQNLPVPDAPPPCTTPSAGIWRKVIIAPGVELMYETTTDSRKEAAIQKLIAEAIKILSDV